MLVQGRTNSRLVVAALATAFTLIVSALPASALTIHKQDGVSASTITLGITVPLTGAAAPGYNKVPYAMQAYFNYVNDNGGVNGRKISHKR